MNTAPSIACKILRHLQSGKSLTSLEALNRFGTMRLPARVHELNKQLAPFGQEITSEIINKGGKKFARYSMKP